MSAGNGWPCLKVAGLEFAHANILCCLCAFSIRSQAMSGIILRPRFEAVTVGAQDLQIMRAILEYLHLLLP